MLTMQLRLNRGRKLVGNLNSEEQYTVLDQAREGKSVGEEGQNE